MLQTNEVPNSCENFTIYDVFLRFTPTIFNLRKKRKIDGFFHFLGWKFPAISLGEMNRNGKLHAVLATARIANVPSVVSNVWLGAAMGMMLYTSGEHRVNVPGYFWWVVGQLSVAGICLYVAGNFLNDWMDRKWDLQNRPERALPRRLFKPVAYLASAMLLAITGVALAGSLNGPTGIVALGIVFSIVIYTICHKQTAWSVLPMGLCRALLPIMGAVAMIQNPADLTFAKVLPLTGLAAGIFFYIVALSLSARCESKNASAEFSGYLSLGLFLAVPVLMLWPFYLTGKSHLIFYFAAIPYLVWIVLCKSIFRKPIPRYVSALLAGIPIVDWIAMLSLGMIWDLKNDSISSFGISCFIVPPIAFVAALFLQRLAPAT